MIFKIFKYLNIVTTMALALFCDNVFSDTSTIPIDKLKLSTSEYAIENQYIIVLKDDFIEENDSVFLESTENKIERHKNTVANLALEISGRSGSRVRHHYHNKLRGFSATMDQSQLEEILKDERIAYIEQDELVHVDEIQTNATWGLDRIDQEDLPLNSEYQYEYTGTGVTAYIVDTGIDPTHPEFDGRVGTGLDMIGDGYGTDDCHSHGTHVAGTVGGETYGVAKDVTLIPVRVLACNGFGSRSNILAALNWILENASGPSVVNMSIGGGSSASYTTTVTSLVDAGITVVAAAGNNDDDACFYAPSGIPAAITVAASGSTDDRAYFSNFGDCVDLFAPGVSVLSASIYGGASYKSGTSMAAPHVAGVVALYLEKHPSANPYDIDAAIKAQAASNKITDVLGSPNLLLQTELGGLSTLFIADAEDWGGSNSNFPASNVIDGSLDWNSRWEATSTTPVNLVLDLGSVQNISELGISWGKGGVITYNFEIWARATISDAWTKVRTRGNSTGNSASIEPYDITDIDAQYVRIKIHSNSGATDITTIKEVEIYGQSDKTELTIATAFDDGKSAGSYPATNAIDGNLEWRSRWAASDLTSVNLTIQLEESNPVSSMAIAWGRGDQYIYTFEVYARDDTSGAWTKVFDGLSSGRTDNFELFDLTDIDAQQIRIKSFGSSLGDEWTNIKEVLIFGPAD